MAPRPPISTLFPYTTLFRSMSEASLLAQVPLFMQLPPASLAELAERLRGRRMNKGDRKSTRLNSSHSQISYAVFCLKKKTKKQIHRQHRRTSLTESRHRPSA